LRLLDNVCEAFKLNMFKKYVFSRFEMAESEYATK